MDSPDLNADLNAALAIERAAEQWVNELIDARIEVEMEMQLDAELHRKLHILTNAFAAADERAGVPVEKDPTLRRKRYQFHAVTAVAVARLNAKRGIQ